nr:hypothetical protein CFP56_22396 [Quercus suber]
MTSLHSVAQRFEVDDEGYKAMNTKVAKVCRPDCSLQRNRKSSGLVYSSLQRAVIAMDPCLLSNPVSVAYVCGRMIWLTSVLRQRSPDIYHPRAELSRCVEESSWNDPFQLSYQQVSFLEQKFPQRVRCCAPLIMQSAIDCLCSGSPWQVLLSTISSTLFLLSAKTTQSLTHTNADVIFIKFHCADVPAVRQQIERHVDLASICDGGKFRTAFRRVSERESTLLNE